MGKRNRILLSLAIAVILMTTGAGMLHAEPIIKATIDQDTYEVGDLITLHIEVETNPGFHGLYFDLAFNGSVLAFEGLEKGLLIHRVVQDSELLYARSDNQISILNGDHVIVSYSLGEREPLADAITRETGTLVEMRFRVIDKGASNARFRFRFDDFGIWNQEGKELAGAVWEDSKEFLIGEPVQSAFILIKQPQDNQAFYENTVTINAICTAGRYLYVLLSNEETGYLSDRLSAGYGSILGEEVPIIHGFNRIKASLIDSEGTVLAADTVTVLRSEEDRYVRIISPPDHALINTDMVEVRVSSSFDNVTVNSMTAEALGEKDGDNFIYGQRLWLRKGFNRITAISKSPEGAVYQDEITVYYQKDDSVFRFVKPLQGQAFKPGSETTLSIVGEIGSLYKEQDRPNTVTLQVIYYPSNPFLSSRILVNNRPATIKETTIASGIAQAPYMFYNEFSISLEGLDSGEIEIVAYKNREGASWEHEIHRIVYVDNHRLWINLVQPNIFGADTLNTERKITGFNNGVTPDLSQFQLTDEGSFKLKAQKALVKDGERVGENKLADNEIADLIETQDSSIYALVNEQVGMKIYKKSRGADIWETVISRSDMHGYDLCDTGLGILVGVTNLFSNENSGLYLLQEKGLTNIIIGEPITHVQFIVNHNGLVYLYGSDYSHLYAFNLYNLEEDGTRLKAPVFSKIRLDTDYSIRQFELSDDARVSIIRDSFNQVHFYKNLSGIGFEPVDFDDDQLNSAWKFKKIVRGEYQGGKYAAHLLIGEEDDFDIVVMEDKTTHRFIVKHLDHSVPNEELVGVGFRDDHFIFVHHAGNLVYRVRKAQILFDMIYWEDQIEDYERLSEPIPVTNLQLLPTKEGMLYLGFGIDIPEERRHLYLFTKEYPAYGSTSFHYINQDVEGIVGFSFEIEPVWTDSEKIEFGFAVKEGDKTYEDLSHERAALSTLLKDQPEDKLYSIHQSYDAGRGKEIIHIEFNDLQRSRYLAFEIGMYSQGGTSPSLGNLTVYKRVRVKLPKSDSQIIYLPIHGYVDDTTVNEVYIQEVKVPLERDGSFSYNYPINSSVQRFPMEIYCTNGIGETARLTFVIEIFESKNSLWDIVLEPTVPDVPGAAKENEFYTDTETVRVSGHYYGLTGAIAGYELYGYAYEGENQKLVLLRQAVFETELYSSNPPLPPGLSDLGPGYEVGKFTEQAVKLLPGRQRLILYVENPGGFRTEYKINGLYPEVIYDLKEEDQKILITNIDLITLTGSEVFQFNEVIFDKKIELDVYEVLTEDNNYAFKKNYLIHGEVKSLYKFYHLKVKSYSPAVTFDNGKTETTIEVDPANRFQVGLTITMPDNIEAENYKIVISPTIPFLDWMKTGLSLEATKSFVNTHIVPDFSLMDHWTPAEKSALEKPLRIKFSRFIPESAHIRLLVNYETTIYGALREIDPQNRVYKVMNGVEELDLKGVKLGQNRVQWWVSYDKGLISSSSTGREDMKDYLFSLVEDLHLKPTAIDFETRLKVYYNDTDKPIPPFTLTKDKTTRAKVTLNNKVLFEDEGSLESYSISDWSNTTLLNLVEGRNFLNITYKEKLAPESEEQKYMFLYDSKNPEVVIDSYRYDEDYKNLIELTALIQEVNLDKIDLYYVYDPIAGESKIEGVVEVIHIGEDLYHAKWSALEPHNLIPSPQHPIRVRVLDHSGRPGDSAFTGIGDVNRPGIPTSKMIDISENYYTGIPYFPNDNASDPFSGHMKFFNASIGIDNRIVENSESFKVQRGNNITIGGNVAGRENAVLILQAGKNIWFHEGFSVDLGCRVEAEVVDQSTAVQFMPRVKRFTHTRGSEAISIGFWFREEWEDYYIPSDQPDAYRRILTVYEAEGISIYLGYLEGDNHLYILKETTDETTVYRDILLGNGETAVTFSRGGKDDWNLILLGIQKLESKILLAANDQMPVAAPLDASSYAAIFENMLSLGAKYYFGTLTEESGVEEVDGENTGHFSMARPFYIDEIVDISTALEVIGYQNPNPTPGEEPHRLYRFDSSSDDVGGKYYQLRTFGDHFTNSENADYSEDQTKGSLKASSGHINALEITDQGVIFDDADNPITINLNLDLNVAGGSVMKLAPANPLYPGKYFFGNRFGNHNVRMDRWYSVTGTVLPCVENGEKIPIDARLALRINDREQSMQLQEGAFHFIYHHTTGETPENIIMYLEIRSALKIKKDIVFSEGNYALPEEGVNDIGQSRAQTKYLFYPKGTVHFWYKPFNVNRAGYVSYNALLFDSDFIRIGTEVEAGSGSFGTGCAKFFAELVGKDNDNNPMSVKLPTDVLVKDGWQHIQLSYSRDDRIAYFYIDGKMAAKRENEPLPIPWGISNDNDNVFFGSDRTGNDFAEGYLDEICFSHLYRESLYDHSGQFYNARNPVSFFYSDLPQPGLSITLTSSNAEVQDIVYVLESRDGLFKQKTTPLYVSDHGFDLSRMESGPYILRAKMVINGHRYSHTFSFIKNNRPRFRVMEVTPLIINGVESDIAFRLGYDGSYLLRTIKSVYAGVAVKIQGRTINTKGEEEDFSKILYVTQDFVNQDPKNSRWYYNDEEGIQSGREWQELISVGKTINIVFQDILALSDIQWDLRSFYFHENFNPATDSFASLSPEEEGLIPNAFFTAEIKKRKYVSDHSGSSGQGEDAREYEYKIEVTVGTGSGAILKELDIGYQLQSLDPNEPDPQSGIVDLQGRNKIDIFYDDILQNTGYGRYRCVLSLRYKGELYGDKHDLILNWEKLESVQTPGEEKRLSIRDFSLLNIDTDRDLAQFYLEYDQNNLMELHYDLYVIALITGEVVTEIKNEPLNFHKNYKVLNAVPVPEGRFYVKVSVYSTEDGFLQKAELTLNNSATAPTVVLTNTVPSLIAYNNVMFSWRGYHEGVIKPDIQYAYDFDNRGWSAFNEDWRQVEFYGLSEGYHHFTVKAKYKGEESPEEKVGFFVDINKPLFDAAKIDVEKIVDEDGIPYAVTIIGAEGAISDISLDSVWVNDTPLKLGKNGSFTAQNLPLESDGKNTFVVTAYDEVGNFTDYSVVVENRITEILFPKPGNNIRYAPMTLVGKLSTDIDTECEIYLFDPLCEDRGVSDFDGWRKAKINEDRIFFIEDIYVNPGTLSREIHTPLHMMVKVPSGRVFKRQIDVWANEIIRPIEMDLSTHAVEGEKADTVVEIVCKANVDDISSWSIDFDGDGTYDSVEMVDNPLFGKERTWTHIYSSLGLVTPRVRIITASGHYFSVTDKIIIHEQIKEASHTLISDPLSMSSIRLKDNSEWIFVLAGKDNQHRVEVYEVGRNATYISDRLFTISLDGLGIDNPVKIKALDKEHLYIAGNRNGRGTVHVLKANAFGNYLPVPEVQVPVHDLIYDLDLDNQTLYVSLEHSDGIITVPIENKLPVPEDLHTVTPQVLYAEPLGKRLGLAKDSLGLLVADYYNQRVVRASESFKVLEFTGSLGTGEGEYLKPSLIQSLENRIFVYDEARADIQVFDPGFNPVTTIAYDPQKGDDNYLEPDFLNSVLDMAVVTKEQSNLLYYYVLLLSKSSGKLAMLRLPQWEELRARVRNNKIVFLKDREVIMAKPTGSDLARIVSSDSIPRVEGTLDYPALSPDGRNLVFTSRVELYDKKTEAHGNKEEPNQYAYDNLYIVDVDKKDLVRIPLGQMNHYEIERPVFSFNGDKLIFSAKPTGGNWQIYIYNLQTGGILKLFSSDENARFPYFSPDDRFVVFTTDYDGDEEVEIIDTQNTAVRVAVSSNNARDSFPVWSNLHPFEISNPDLKIESKIALVSERDYHKGLYYLYLKRASESDIRVVTKNGIETEDDPDSAAIEITSDEHEGDYPCFTGDGESLVFEYFDGQDQILNLYDFQEDKIVPIALPKGARKPAGMKNTIANFQAESVNGDEVRFSWTGYTDKKIFYTIRFQKNQEGEPFVEKKVFTHDRSSLKGLEMGVEYLVKVLIIENGVEEAETQWKKVLIPEVAARASYEIDDENPYLVRLHAWKPMPEMEWLFSWIIDNKEIGSAQTSQDFLYEFAFSGPKTIILKATNKANTFTSISEPLRVVIKTDINPVVEYQLIDSDTTYIEMSAEKSTGSKIDLSSASWTITGPGSMPTTVSGSKTIIPLDGYRHKINVNLKLRRKPVSDQTETDIIEKNIVVDLDLKDVKPVITYLVDNNNERLFHFSGDNSLGNIDWFRARWSVYADGIELHREDGVSSFAYQFPEMGKETTYTVTLTVPRRNEGTTKTASVVVAVEPAPLEPVIDYEILSLREDGNVVGAKLLLSCTGSKGSSIDFAQARWTVPVAGAYNEQPTQVGPTAIYNLFTAQQSVMVEVSLALMRKGGMDAKTVTKTINLKEGEVARTEVLVNKTVQESSEGKVLILDVLSSTGPNIDWEKTEWLVNDAYGQHQRKGAVVRIEVPASGQETIVNYVCSVYTHGGGAPIVKRGEEIIGKNSLEPVISCTLLPGGNNNVYELSVIDTPGANIDWERTAWYIYDGNENVVQKQGAQITHAFAFKEETYGYPVMVEMFFKKSSLPFVGYVSVDVEGDELIPVITWDQPADRGDDNVVHFSAKSSKGNSIDWSQCKWTFGDSSESQYGPVVVHKYPIDASKRSYRVSLTVTRRSASGSVETRTSYKTITIGSDTIKPVIRARMYQDGYLVLSAEESEGRGLMLDRSLWIFEGKGDSQSLNMNQKVGKVENRSFTDSLNLEISRTVGFSHGFVATETIGGGVSRSWTIGSTSYEGFKDNTESFSTTNTHTGAICRRYVREYDISKGYWDRDTKRTLMVTLFVYRISADSGMNGRSITVNIDLDKARQGGGVCYE